MIRHVSLTVCALVYCGALAAQTELPSVEDKAADLVRHEGFFSIYRDVNAHRVFVLVDRWDADFLYVNSLPSGVGSNDIGLDRGKLGSTKVVRFERAGPRAMLIQRNLMHRATSTNPDEVRAVDEAFASSVIYGFPIVAATDDKVLIDATEFCLRDAFDVSGALRRSDQGAFKLDPKRSFLHFARCAAFPKNTELSATLTYSGAATGRYVRQVVPTPSLITVRQRHSFIELPDSGYTPRRFDARTGYSPVTWRDYAQPIAGTLVQQVIRRHRLIKKDPKAAVSEPVKPIVYYLDPGAPEPVRSALLDGARWWQEAFTAAGFKNAYRVELLPSGADPMDVRYNVIQWVHRSSRGWSYGNSITDPRTGEILKGHVTLGSRRVRQDYLIAQALIGPDRDRCQALALARLRQLSAHEVGHTLGLAHNFAASGSERASVMDYPHPVLKLIGGQIDLSDAYGVGIGAWDRFVIRWGYSSFAANQEADGLAALLRESQQQGLRYLSDSDARPAGGMHPVAHLWDNGADAITELGRLLAIRKHAMDRFGPHFLAPDEPLTRLDELITPLYLLHRYQIEAVSKMVGGVDYAIAMRGDPMTNSTPVRADAQRAAVKALIGTLHPGVLNIPENLAKAIPPRTHGARRDRELLPSRSGIAFDPLAAAEVAARTTVDLLLHRDRAARLVSQQAVDPAALSLTEAITMLTAATVHAKPATGLDYAVQRVVDHAVVDGMIALAADARAAPSVRAISRSALRGLKFHDSPHGHALVDQIKAFFAHPERYQPRPALDAPPGSPIGCACGHGADDWKKPR